MPLSSQEQLQFSETLNTPQEQFSDSLISFDAKLRSNTGMDAKQIRKQNLEILIARTGKAATFAEKVGTAAAYISQILSDKTKAHVGDDLARRIETACDLPHGWMDERHDLRTAEKAGADEKANVYPGPDLRGRVPLISWVKAGAFAEAEDLLQPGEAMDWIDTTVQARQHTFALRVEGDSMEPDFPAGMILVVEPEMEAHAGDFVIVKNGAEEATFKQLVRDGGDWYLKPMNARYPIKPLAECRIVGVVREAVRKLR